MSERENVSNTTNKMQPNTSAKRLLQRGKGRKFFQQMQPTFAVDVPTTSVKLQFLDENDPAKDTIVRKKAREWVNKNRDTKNQDRQKQERLRTNKACQTEKDENEAMQLQRVKCNEAANVLVPMQGVGLRQFDPFNIFPDVGRKFDHIIEFFLTGCPEEIPCSDDKYADKANKSLVAFSSENTVLGNMAKSQITFILWLYATVTIRDGMRGNVETEEVYWFYNKALEVLQQTLKKDTDAGKYSNELLNAVTCITATASFAGMFSTAALHRDAIIRVLKLQGEGDLLRGLQLAPPWTRKAIQWCEIMVAAQLAETPQVPYHHSMGSEPLPDSIIYKANQLTANTLSSLPPVSEPIQHVIRLLHQIGVAYANPSKGAKVDTYVIQPLYDAQYAILQIQEAHKKTGILSDVEHLLVETFQLYFWTGARMLPPQTRLCDLLVSRLMKALLSLLLEKVPEEVELEPVTARGYPVDDADHVLETLYHPRTTNNVIAWSLALGTMVTTPLNRPEYAWLSGHFRLHISAMGLDQEDKYCGLLEVFPTTQISPCIDLRTLFSTLLT